MKDAILDLHSKTQKLSLTQLKAYIENLTSMFEVVVVLFFATLNGGILDKGHEGQVEMR
jgi:hypothetical protein